MKPRFSNPTTKRRWGGGDNVTGYVWFSPYPNVMVVDVELYTPSSSYWKFTAKAVVAKNEVIILSKAQFEKPEEAFDLAIETLQEMKLCLSSPANTSGRRLKRRL